MRAWTKPRQNWMRYVLPYVVPPLRLPYNTSFPSINYLDSVAVLYPSPFCRLQPHVSTEVLVPWPCVGSLNIQPPIYSSVPAIEPLHWQH